MQSKQVTIAIIILLPLAASCSPTPGIGRYNFDAAIDEASTTYPFVKIHALPADLDGQFDRCVAADSLLRAIIAENGLTEDATGFAAARSIAKAAKGQRFEFKDRNAAVALNAPLRSKTMATKACLAIDQGRPAKIGDYAPDLLVGDGRGGWIKVQ